MDSRVSFSVPFTPREARVLLAIARGLTEREIAAALGLSRYQVAHHARCVMLKLAARNRSHAIARACSLCYLMPAADSYGEVDLAPELTQMGEPG
jgi:DNA-binding CsgD family transcriptional regulator